VVFFLAAIYYAKLSAPSRRHGQAHTASK